MVWPGWMLKKTNSVSNVQNADTEHSVEKAGTLNKILDKVLHFEVKEEEIETLVEEYPNDVATENL